MANGKYVHNGAIAVDPYQFPLGTKFLLDGKEVIAEDTGGDIGWNRIDIWMPSCQDAIKFGVERKVLWE